MGEKKKLTYGTAELGEYYESYNQNTGRNYKYRIIKKRTSTCDVIRYKHNIERDTMKFMNYEYFKQKDNG